MARRYAPQVPDVSLYRPGDVAYLQELLKICGSRAAERALGWKERTARNRLSGETLLFYPEQYCLEVLADQRTSEMNVQNEPRPGAKMTMEDVERAQEMIDREDLVHSIALSRGEPTEAASPKTIWHNIKERPLGAIDAGRMIVGTDRFGAPIFGMLIRDGFGLVVQSADGIDVRSVPVDRVSVYTLIDPPPAVNASDITG